jgi:hypothetical protein
MTMCSRAFAVGEHRVLELERPAAESWSFGRGGGAVELSRVELVVMGLLPRQRGEGGELELRCEGPHSVGVAGSQPFQGAEG